MIQSSSVLTNRSTRPPHRYWTAASVWIRLADSAQFAELSNRLARALESAFDGGVVLWFSGFPVTGERRKVLVTRPGTGAEAETSALLRGEFKLLWNLRERALDEAVASWIAAHAEQDEWVKTWTSLLDPMDATTTHDSFTTPNASAPIADLRASGIPWERKPAAAGDLYIVGTDERIYRVPKERYTHSAESSPAFETIEFQLSQQILSAGAEVAAIPSIGLPVRGSFCFIVRMNDH